MVSHEFFPSTLQPIHSNFEDFFPRLALRFGLCGSGSRVLALLREYASRRWEDGKCWKMDAWLVVWNNNTVVVSQYSG
jgi:hypothetical protein